MSEDTIISILTGPVSGLGLCIIMILYVGRFAGKYVPQLVDRHLDQMSAQMDAQGKIISRLEEMQKLMADQHELQNETIRRAISGLHGRLNPMENDLKEVRAVVLHQQKDNS